jgi:hypothetical protein
MRIIDRLDQYMRYKSLNDNEVTVRVGLSIGLLGKSRKEGADIGKKSIEKILSFYKDLNRVWLLTGEGEMLIEKPLTKFESEKKKFFIDEETFRLTIRLVEEASETVMRRLIESGGIYPKTFVDKLTENYDKLTEDYIECKIRLKELEEKLKEKEENMKKRESCQSGSGDTNKNVPDVKS